LHGHGRIANGLENAIPPQRPMRSTVTASVMHVSRDASCAGRLPAGGHFYIDNRLSITVGARCAAVKKPDRDLVTFGPASARRGRRLSLARPGARRLDGLEGYPLPSIINQGQSIINQER
jgi:hypothetical protein